MRIVGGALGGRRFSPPADIPARPTTDLAREGLFNILNNLIDFDGCTALELFAGTGSVSYELASRGAVQITAVEQDMASANFIKKMAADFKIADRLKVIKGDAFKTLQTATAPFDFIFADPPYALAVMDQLPQLIFDRSLLTEEGLFVLEHDYRHSYETHPHFMRAKKYGDTIFTFFTASPGQ
jgi:16S rRNA (guanine(966)-N(2))-methyltransferase RsmD